jgi:hypothetical protein
LLLPLQHPQPESLLGVFDIPLNGLLFAVDFLNSQIAKRHHNGRQKQQHSSQWRKHSKAVLTLGCLKPPPPINPLEG